MFRWGGAPLVIGFFVAWWYFDWTGLEVGVGATFVLVYWVAVILWDKLERIHAAIEGRRPNVEE